MRFLSGRKFLFILLFLAACTTAYEEYDVLQTLAEEGILAPFDPEDVQPMQFNLTRAEIGDIIQSWEIPIMPATPRTASVQFESGLQADGFSLTAEAWEYGRFSGMNVLSGQQVSEGDFIAELYFEIPETLRIDLYALALEREQFEANFIQEQTRRQIEIQDLYYSLATAVEWELIALNLSRAELQYQQFLRTSNRSRENFDQRQYDLMENRQSERLYSPIDGIVAHSIVHISPGYIRNVSNPDWFPLNIRRRIAYIVDESYRHFLSGIPTNTAGIHQHYVLIYGQVLPIYVVGATQLQATHDLNLMFYATVATDPLTTDVISTGENHPIRFIPYHNFDEFMAEVEIIQNMGIDFFNTFSLHARPDVPLALNSVIVDTRAIIPEGNRHFVMLYENGNVGKRYVTIGTQLDIRTQVLSGLEAGQLVVIP